MRTFALKVCALLVLSAAVVSSGAVAAAAVTNAPSGWPVPYLSQVYSGLTEPLFVTGDGTGQRTYVLERPGRVKVGPKGGTTLTTFLDISAKTTTASERGLLGIAFPPGYAGTGRFYVCYTQPDGDVVVARYQRDPGNSDLALPASEQIVLTVTHQAAGNHNGGWIAFGPDGYLYVAIGDGGGGGDPFGNGQNRNTLLGKILRIDVEGGSPTYTVPADNPFVGVPGARSEIWAWGVRNPWRNSFDASGTLYVADVGQNTWEELNVAAPGVGGQNYGWDTWEGNVAYPIGTPAPSKTGFTFPVAAFKHPGAESITGGYRYEGAKHPQMRGTYIFGDYVLGKIQAMRTSGSAYTTVLLDDTAHLIASFGEDDDKELYTCSFGTGRVYAVGDARTYSTRLSGSDRFAAATQIARASYPGGFAGVTDVVIASGDDRAAADPLAAAGLCWAYDAPLLLVSANSSPSSVRTLLSEIDAANTSPLTLHVVGGTVSVPNARLTELVASAGTGATAERVLASGDRYQMAAAIARRMQSVRPGDFPSRGLFANGAESATFFDALALAPIARKTGAPILLVGPTSVPAATAATADDLGLTERWVAGGTRTVSDGVLATLGIPGANRMSGADRYATARAVADTAITQTWLTPGTVGVAAALPDAVAGGAAAGRAGGPMLTTASTTLSSAPSGFLTSRNASVTTVWVLGGPNSLADDVMRSIALIREP